MQVVAPLKVRTSGRSETIAPTPELLEQRVHLGEEGQT